MTLQRYISVLPTCFASGTPNIVSPKFTTHKHFHCAVTTDTSFSSKVSPLVSAWRQIFKILVLDLQNSVVKSFVEQTVNRQPSRRTSRFLLSKSAFLFSASCTFLAFSMLHVYANVYAKASDFTVHCEYVLRDLYYLSLSTVFVLFSPLFFREQQWHCCVAVAVAAVAWFSGSGAPVFSAFLRSWKRRKEECKDRRYLERSGSLWFRDILCNSSKCLLCSKGKFATILQNFGFELRRQCLKVLERRLSVISIGPPLAWSAASSPDFGLFNRKISVADRPGWRPWKTPVGRPPPRTPRVCSRMRPSLGTTRQIPTLRHKVTMKTSQAFTVIASDMSSSPFEHKAHRLLERTKLPCKPHASWRHYIHLRTWK